METQKQITEAAKRIAQMHEDLRSDRITVSEGRALNRQIRAEIGNEGMEQAKFAVAAHASRN